MCPVIASIPWYIYIGVVGCLLFPAYSVLAWRHRRLATRRREWFWYMHQTADEQVLDQVFQRVLATLETGVPEHTPYVANEALRKALDERARSFLDWSSTRARPLTGAQREEMREPCPELETSRWESASLAISFIGGLVAAAALVLSFILG